MTSLCNKKCWLTWESYWILEIVMLESPLSRDSASERAPTRIYCEDLQFTQSKFITHLRERSDRLFWNVQPLYCTYIDFTVTLWCWYLISQIHSSWPPKPPVFFLVFFLFISNQVLLNYYIRFCYSLSFQVLSIWINSPKYV